MTVNKLNKSSKIEEKKETHKIKIVGHKIIPQILRNILKYQQRNASVREIQ